MSGIYHWLGFIVFWALCAFLLCFGGALLWLWLVKHKTRIWAYQVWDARRFYLRWKKTGRLTPDPSKQQNWGLKTVKWRQRLLVRKLSCENEKRWYPFRRLWRLWYSWELMILDLELAGLEWGEWSMGVKHAGTDVSAD